MLPIPLRGPDVLIIGAGPHALAAAVYLLSADPALSGRLAVADPAPWLTSWHRRFARFELTGLRSAGVHHPHPSPYALLNFASHAGREYELSGAQGRPGVRLFTDFCDSLIECHDLATARLPATVDALYPRDDGRVDVLLAGETIRVGHVVLATGCARPHVPVLGARHADSVELHGVRPGDRVCVIGGGLTAAHLALRAAGRGARVLLLSRATLAPRAMDVEPVWLGHALPAFARTSPAARAAAVRAARTGTVPAEVLRALRAEPRVRLHVGSVCQVLPGGVVLADGRRLTADAVWLATGHTHDLRADPLTAGLLSRVPVPVVDGLPVLDDDLEWGGAAVHVTGPLAALHVGPAARNLAGARIAAERYVGCVSGVQPTRLQYPNAERAAH